MTGYTWSNNGTDRMLFTTRSTMIMACKIGGMACCTGTTTRMTRSRTFQGAYWCLGMEAAIDPRASVEIVGDYAPLASGFRYEELGVVPRPPAAFE